MREIKSSCFRLTSHLNKPTFSGRKKKVFSSCGRYFGAEGQSDHVHLHMLCQVNCCPNFAVANIGAACLHQSYFFSYSLGGQQNMSAFLPHHRSKQCGCLPALPTGVYSSSSSAVWRTCSFFSRQSHPDNLKEPSFPIWTEPCVLIWKFLVWLSHSSFSRNGTCTYLHLVMTVLWIFVADQNEGSLQDLSDHSLGSAFRILLISFIGNGIENLK